MARKRSTPGFLPPSETVLTEQDLRAAFFERYAESFPWVFANAVLGSWECDLLTLDANGLTTEWEIKVSRADFKNDRKKTRPAIPGRDDRPDTKFDAWNAGFGPNRFGYLTPAGLIDADELPAFAGWMVFEPDARLLTTLREPVMLHPDPASPELVMGWIRSVYNRFWHYKTRESASDLQLSALRRERDQWERRWAREAAFIEKNRLLTDAGLRGALASIIADPATPEPVRTQLAALLIEPDF